MSVKHRVWKIEKKTKRTSHPTDHPFFFRVRHQNVILHFDVLPVFDVLSAALVTFFPPPLQFSKILLKWGGGKQKSIVLLHFDVPPPNRVTKGVVMLSTNKYYVYSKYISGLILDHKI